MSVAGPGQPHHPGGGRDVQGQSQPGRGDVTSGRDMWGGTQRDSDPRQDERFSRALQRAMTVPATTKAEEVEEPDPDALPFAMASPLMPAPPTRADAELAPSARAPVEAVAQRIDRYLRGAEGGRMLRQGEGMVVKLPPNVLGVGEVCIKVQGDVLLVTVGMTAQSAVDAAMQAQLALLGQALALRQPRQSIRVVAGETADADRREDRSEHFNPLIPRGRAG